MFHFRLHPEAQNEAFAAREYITADDLIEGELFGSAVDDALARSCEAPLIYACFDGEFRKIRVGKFRYNLVFRIRGEEIQILAVMHMSRRPGYWKKRATTWPE